MNQHCIFITGAASGIGRATADFFHQKGWFVGGFDMDAAGLESLEKDLAGQGMTAILDVSDKAAFDNALAAFAKQTEGRLDLMFNNAGVTVGGFFDEVPYDKIINMVNVNLIGVLNGAHAAIPYLKQTKNSLCLSTSSSAAMYGTPGMAIYGTTKFAVKGFTHAMSVELARYGVRAADVMPGTIDTPLWRAKKYEKGEAVASYEHRLVENADKTDASRTIAPIEVAKAVWDAYHGTKLHWYVPPELEDNDISTAAGYEKRRDEIIAAALGGPQ